MPLRIGASARTNALVSAGFVALVASIVHAAPAIAAVLGHFPSQVQGSALEITGAGYVAAPTPAPHISLGHYPPDVTAPQLVMTGSGYVPVPTHINLAHFPSDVNAPPLQMTGAGGP